MEISSISSVIYFPHLVNIPSACFILLFLSFVFTLVAAIYFLWMNVAQITVALLISLLISNYGWKMLQKRSPLESALTYLPSTCSLLIPLPSSRPED